METYFSAIQLKDQYLEEIHCQLLKEEDNFLEITPLLQFTPEKKEGRIKLKFLVIEKNVSVSGAIVGVFNYEEDMDEDDAKSLIVNNGTTILFPYLRAAVSGVTNISNVPIITIPTFNIIKYLNDKFNE